MLLDEEEVALEVLVEVLLEAEDCLVVAGLVLLDTETTPVPVDAVDVEV